MGILTRFTLRTLAKSRTRTVVSIIGIALSCALITAIFSTITSIEGGIIQHEIESLGSWEVSFSGLSANALTRLENDDRATNVAVSYELGSAIADMKELQAFADAANESETDDTAADGTSDANSTDAVETDGVGSAEADEATATETSDADSSDLSESSTNNAATSYPSYLTVKTLPQSAKGNVAAWATRGTGEVALSALPQLTEGSLPQSSSEIVLPLSYKGEQPQGLGITSDGGIQLGSTVTLAMGRRVRTDASGAQTPQSAADIAAQVELNGATEELTNVSEHTYTVVGFMGGTSYGYSGELTTSAAGSVALTAPTDAQSAGENASASAFVTTSIASYDQIESWADEVCGAANYNGTGTPGVAITHDNLLRYQGRTDGRAIWYTLWQMAAILCGVVMLASVSLIYTAFAISVTERTRQLGLLSGIGASRRQLRQSVLIEALLLGAVGIPVGLALGIAGTAVTFGAMSEEFASLLETSVAVGITLDWRVLLVAVLLSLVTLLVSALIPAVKASRASAIDAMRQSGTVRVRKHRGRVGGRIAQALFGVPGLVAHRNLTRSGSRSRVVVVSLAVSVALVIACGCLDAYMQPLMGAANRGSYPDGTDALVYLSSYDTQSDGSTNLTDALTDFRSQLSEVEGASEVAAELSTSIAASIPATMVGDDVSTYLKDNEGVLESTPFQLLGDAATQEERSLSNVADDGSVAANLSVYYLEDSDWRAFVSQLGLSEDEYCDASHPRAIGINSFMTSDGSRYVTMSGIQAAGTITLYSSEPNAAEIDGAYSFYGVYTTPDGQTKLAYATADKNGNTSLKTVDANDATCVQTLEVGAVTTQVPDCLKGSGINYAFPQVILPASAIGSVAGAASATDGAATSCLTAQVANLYLSVDENTNAAKELDDIASVFSERNEGTSLFFNNFSESLKSSLDSARLLQVLIILFSVITMLIALANVFNTLTNSIILRTREFAMLRSCGMGDRAFAKMMVYECASYALRGLAGGIVLAAGISWLMWNSMELAFSGVGLAMPAPYVLLACAGAAVVLALSAVYALRRSHAQNLVEALRCDAL